MMHLILKRTSQEIQYKMDHSLENGAHLSIWAATVVPPPVHVFFFFFFSFTEKETPASVHLIVNDHVISYFLQESHHAASADTVGSVFAGRLRLFQRADSFLAPCWDDELKQGALSLFGSGFRDNQTHQDQVDLCTHVQVYSDFSLERNHCVKQLSMLFMVCMLFSSSVVQMIKILYQ